MEDNYIDTTDLPSYIPGYDDYIGDDYDPDYCEACGSHRCSICGEMTCFGCSCEEYEDDKTDDAIDYELMFGRNEVE